MRSRCRCSMCPAIHITSRSWLRSSSTREPSDPPLRDVIVSLSRTSRRRRWTTPRSSRRYDKVLERKRKKNARVRGDVRRLRAIDRSLNLRRVFRAGYPRRTLRRSIRRARYPVTRTQHGNSIGARFRRASLSRTCLRAVDVVVVGANRRTNNAVTVMILPQVHLRKPCYDFYFL